MQSSGIDDEARVRTIAFLKKIEQGNAVAILEFKTQIRTRISISKLDHRAEHLVNTQPAAGKCPGSSDAIRRREFVGVNGPEFTSRNGINVVLNTEAIPRE